MLFPVYVRKYKRCLSVFSPILAVLAACYRAFSFIIRDAWLQSKCDEMERAQQGIEPRVDSRDSLYNLRPLRSKQMGRNGQNKPKPACGKGSIFKQRKQKSIREGSSLIDTSVKLKRKIPNVLYTSKLDQRPQSLLFLPLRFLTPLPGTHPVKTSLLSLIAANSLDLIKDTIIDPVSSIAVAIRA